MKRYLFKLAFLFLISIILFSCEDDVELTPEQIERNQIIEVENMLRNNTWGFKDLVVTVQHESMAIPLLANVADENGMVQPGVYDSYDIYGNNNRQQYYAYQFTRDDIMEDTSGAGTFSRMGGYFVINTDEIRINFEGADAIRYSYDYIPNEGIFNFYADQARSGKFVDATNKMITHAILNQTPGEISDAVVNKLLTSEKVAEAIENFLYDLIHGKIDAITQSPEEVSEELANIIVNQIQQIDWETILHNKLVVMLQKLQVGDPESRATEMAERISTKIQASITQADLYDLIYPILQNFEVETIPVLTSKIAESVYLLISQVLSEENIYNKFYPLWENFSQVDSLVVENTSDTLASVLVSHFFDTNSLAQRLLPFVTEVDATPVYKLGNISQEIIDSTLIPIVDTINSFFPSLGLSPNWGTIKPVITAGLTTIKSLIGTSTLEEFSEDLAGTIIALMDFVIREGVEIAIYKLQEIPADQAASVVASWITNLVGMAEQPVIDFIEGKLNDILAHFDAILIAEEISELLYQTLITALSEENLYQIVLPVLETINDANMENVADEIVEWLMDSGLIKDAITEEQAVTAISGVLSTLVSNVEPDEATQLLVDGIVGADILDNVNGTILSLVLEIKLYQLLIKTSKDLNAISQIEIEIIEQ